MGYEELGNWFARACPAMEVVQTPEALDALEHLAEVLPAGTGLERRNEVNLLRRRPAKPLNQLFRAYFGPVSARKRAISTPSARVMDLAERIITAKEEERVEVHLQLLSGSQLGTLQLRLQDTVAWWQ